MGSKFPASDGPPASNPTRVMRRGPSGVSAGIGTRVAFALDMSLLGTVLEQAPRQTVRGVIIANELFVLLIKVRDPLSGQSFWLTPGGAVRPDEELEEAVRRKLHEEIGLTHADIGPVLWSQSHDFEWAGTMWSQDETYFLVSSSLFEPLPGRRSRGVSHILGYRWWLIPSIREASETFAPPDLGRLLEQLREAGPPGRVVSLP